MNEKINKKIAKDLIKLLERHNKRRQMTISKVLLVLKREQEEEMEELKFIKNKYKGAF